MKKPHNSKEYAKMNTGLRPDLVKKTTRKKTTKKRTIVKER